MKSKICLARPGWVALLAASLMLSCVSVVNADSGDTPQLEVVVMDVGQGDGIFIRTPSGRHYLIDAGPSAAAGVLPYLRSRNITAIDGILLTHPHADHIGGAVGVMAFAEVRQIFDSGKNHPTPEYRRLLEEVESRGIPYRQPIAGETLDWDPLLTVQVFHPDGPHYKNVNDNSIIVRIIYKNRAFVFTGDAEVDAEDVAGGSFGRAIRSDVLKVGHHGSRTSSTPDFLDLVRPKYALISCGRRNSFGHPHPQTLENLRAVNARVLRTDLDGFLLFRTDGEFIRWARTKLPFPLATMNPGRVERPAAAPWSGRAVVKDGSVDLSAHPGENLWLNVASAPMWLRPAPESPEWAFAAAISPPEGSKCEAGLILYRNAKNFVLLGVQANSITALTVMIDGKLSVASESVQYAAQRLAFRVTPDWLEALVFDESNKTWRAAWKLSRGDLPDFSSGAKMGFYSKSWGGSASSASFNDIRLSQ